jgi:hypothetical protein
MQLFAIVFRYKNGELLVRRGLTAIMFDIMSILFPIVFILVLGIIIIKAVSGIHEWHHNNQQPVLTVDAKVVSKRSHVSRSMHNHSGHMHHHTRTTYFVTFEVQSGDCMELRVPDTEYGFLVEGDLGKLTFQGTRYKEFAPLKNSWNV